MVGNCLAKSILTLHVISICTSLYEQRHSTTGLFTKTTTTGTFSRVLFYIERQTTTTAISQIIPALDFATQITKQWDSYYFIVASTVITELRERHRYFSWFLMSNLYRSDIFFQLYDSKESELLKHSVVEQNLLVTTCWQSKLGTIGCLCFQLWCKSNIK